MSKAKSALLAAASDVDVAKLERLLAARKQLAQVRRQMDMTEECHQRRMSSLHIRLNVAEVELSEAITEVSA